MILSLHCTWDECHLTPSLILREVRCDNAACGAVHAHQFIAHWLFWAVMLTCHRG